MAFIYTEKFIYTFFVRNWILYKKDLYDFSLKFASLEDILIKLRKLLINDFTQIDF